MILSKRKNQTLKRLVKEIVIEAEHLNVSENELLQLIQAAYKDRGELE
jgi:DNA-binding transcriptional regulator YhcF (GntR family)